MTTLTARQHILLFVLFLSFAAIIAYFHMTKYDIWDPTTGGKEGDVGIYVKMYEGMELNEIPKPYLYRFIVPTLARLVPDIPEFLAPAFDLDRDRIIAYKFGTVNLIGLTIAAYFLFLFLALQGFTFAESLIGVLFFYTSFFIVNFGAVPLVDAWAYATISAGLCALLRRSWPWLVVVMVLGMFIKETAVVIAVVVPFLAWDRRERVHGLLACLPGIALYALVRLIIVPTDFGYSYTFERLFYSLARFGQLTGLVRMIQDFVFVYGLLWVFAYIGWRMLHRGEVDPSGRSRDLYRLSVLVPITFIAPYIVGSVFGRVWFLSFPVVIGLSLFGLRRLFPLGPGEDEPLEIASD
ncbi:MAG: hypothetical protein MAG453_00553 [Calditrichaeota bacterium]|nr:hypothetical protein [Calditrichota bacterium]